MENYENRHDPGPPRNLAPPGVKSQLVILGSGNPVPNPYRFGPASAIVVNGMPYLFDAGEGVWRGLAKAATFHGGVIARAFAVDNLTHLFITHMHPDHTIGIPALILQPWYLNRALPMDILGAGDTAALTRSDAWKDTIELDLAGTCHNAEWLESARARFRHRHLPGRLSDQNVKAFQHKHWSCLQLRHRSRPDRAAIGGDGPRTTA
jgi:ribonuclease BN (tRNA processing enzyme)